MSDSFILDTCVLSEASKSRPHPSVTRFLQGGENLLLPSAVIMEFQLGITKAAAIDPVRAVRLTNWYQRTVLAGLPILDTTKEVAEVWGILAADPRFRSLITGDTRAKRPRDGQDLHVAAFAIALRYPIATMNVTDFALIDRCYPLPGVYNPMADRWHGRIEPLYPEEGLEEERSRPANAF